MVFRFSTRPQRPLTTLAVGLCVSAAACGRIGYDTVDPEGGSLSAGNDVASTVAGVGGGPGVGGSAGDRGIHPTTGGPATTDGAAGVGGIGGAAGGSATSGAGGVSGAGGAAGSAGSTAGGAGGSGPCAAKVLPTGWVCINPGKSVMGSPTNEAGRSSNEDIHAIAFSKPFLLKTTEETQAEWQSAMGSNPSTYRTCGSSCPVETISWNEAVAYANVLSQRDGYPPCYEKPGGGFYDVSAAGLNQTPVWTGGLTCTGYRLPTESEWEYAARAGTNTAFWSGSITATQSSCAREPSLEPIAWYCNTASATHAVGSKSPNPWGLYDVAGNVWEWVWDYEGTYPASALDPIGPASGTRRVDRGGSYFSYAADCRSAARLADTPRASYPDLGFRLARSLP